MIVKKTINVPQFKESNGFYASPKSRNIMKKVKGVNTKPEIRFRKALWQKGIRYRINYKGLLGKPDLYCKKYNIIIFIDGDFWHGYNWENEKSKIHNNFLYWIPKIERNMQRDIEVTEALEKAGYKVFRFWEHEINNSVDECLSQVIGHIRKSEY